MKNCTPVALRNASRQTLHAWRNATGSLYEYHFHKAFLGSEMVVGTFVAAPVRGT